MKWPPEAVLAGLSSVSWEILRKTLRPDCCVAATRIGIAVLKRFGIEGKPLNTYARAFNKLYMDWITSGEQARGQPPSDAARFVEIDTDDTDHDPTKRHRFAGHLIITGKVRGQVFLCDLTAQQFHRPDKAIIIPGGTFRLKAEPILPTLLALPEAGGLLYQEHPRPDLRWEDAPDWALRAEWRREAFYQACAEIIEAVEKYVESTRRD